MKNAKKIGLHHTSLAAALLMIYGGQAQAVEFETEGGWQGNWNTTASVGSSWRTKDADPGLYSAKDGARIPGLAAGTGGTNTDSGTLNWGKGDRFSTPIKVVSDVSLKKGDMGMFVRGKAWYDDALINGNVRVGNGDQGHTAGTPLSDSSQPAMNKFTNVVLLDAYVYNTFDVGNKPVQVRAGNQVINWGESLFIQGLNQTNPIDIAALRKPGTEIKEALLPVWSLSANLGLGDGASLEGFYQAKWASHNIDSCGGYWSPVEWAITTSPGSGCSAVATTAGLTATNSQLQAGGAYVPLSAGKDGKDSGQFGLAWRFPVKSLDSEVGLYAMQINSRAPFISGQKNVANAPPNPRPGLPAYAAAFGGKYDTAFWEYPDNIKVYGASISTNIAGWSVGGELSHTPEQPVQINGNDLLNGVLAGVGPLAAAKSATPGTTIQGYDLIKKTQLQVNTIKVLPSMLGAAQGMFVAEAAMQWNQLPDNGRRYGRAFIFGLGAGPNMPVSPCVAGTALTNPQQDGCKNDGYVTPVSSGLRLKASLDYPGFVGGYTFTPSLFVAKDIKGYSSDSQFIQGRQILTYGARFDYQKKYAFDFNYTTFGNAAYDPFRDRDFISATFSATF